MKQTHKADNQTSCPDVLQALQAPLRSVLPDVLQDPNQCVICADDINTDRVALLKANDMPVTCLMCGEEQARQARLSWCIAPISNKAGYTRITDYDLLKQINPKRTEV
jgi:hypothetical protein